MAPASKKCSHPTLLVAALVSNLSSIWREGGQVALELNAKGCSTHFYEQPCICVPSMRNVRDCISVLVTVCSACFLLTSLPCAGATRLTVSTLCFQAFCMKSEAALCRAGGAHPATCIEREAFSIPHSSFPQIHTGQVLLKGRDALLEAPTSNHATGGRALPSSKACPMHSAAPTGPGAACLPCLLEGARLLCAMLSPAKREMML